MGLGTDCHTLMTTGIITMSGNSSTAVEFRVRSQVLSLLVHLGKEIPTSQLSGSSLIHLQRLSAQMEIFGPQSPKPCRVLLHLTLASEEKSGETWHLRQWKREPL